MKRLTLTFDNGPHAQATPALLDFLAARGIKAYFFLVGACLADPAARRAAERARAEGHRLGNHTMRHVAPLGRMRADRAIAEIDEAQAMLGDLADPDRLFRPIGGGMKGPHLLSRAAADHLAAGGYTVVTWTSVPGDFRATGRDWPQRALADLAATDWTVLVLHDEDVAWMLDGLAGFLDAVARTGAEIVQALPAACTPILRGTPNTHLTGLVT